MNLESGYIYDDKVLFRIYLEASERFFAKAENEICFSEVCEYVHKKLIQRKQCVYSHSLMIVNEVCKRIGESFEDSVSFYAPDAKSYRDLYYSIY